MECAVCTRPSGSTRFMRFDCNRHGFHVACLRPNTAATCPHCNCARCTMEMSAPERVYMPCRCSVHSKCSTGLSRFASTCKRCNTTIVATVDASSAGDTAAPSAAGVPKAASTTPVPDLAESVAKLSVAPSAPRTATLREIFFGPTTPDPKRVSQLVETSKIAGLLEANITFEVLQKAGQTVASLATYGATYDDLKKMGIKKHHLLSATHYSLEAFEAVGFTYARLRDVGVKWPELRAKDRISFPDLLRLRPTLFDLCMDGFDYDALKNDYAQVKFPLWASEPFNLRSTPFMMLPDQNFGLKLTRTRVEELRGLCPGNWTLAQVAKLWGPDGMPQEYRDIFG